VPGSVDETAAGNARRGDGNVDARGAPGGSVLILCGVDAAALRERADTVDTAQTVALGNLLERINERAERHDQYSQVIADEVDEPAKHRSDVCTYRLSGTRGHLSSQLSRIVDTLHFAPSSASRLVQAADFVAFLHRRIEVHPAGDERAMRANQALWAPNRCPGCAQPMLAAEEQGVSRDARRPRVERGLRLTGDN
jgi:hypothetical protein